MPQLTANDVPHVSSDYVFDPAAKHPPDVTYYDGLFGEGDLALWVGREKHRKTTVILQLAVCAALGRNFLNFQFKHPTPLRVVILDWESKTASLKRRYDAVCKAMALTEPEQTQLAEHLRIIEVRRLIADGVDLPKFPVKNGGRPAPDHAAALQFWKNLAKDHPANLYIIDPMRCLHAQDENDSAIESLLQQIRRVFGKAAVVIAHHMTKRGSPKDSVALKDDMRVWSDGARGSGAIKAHADVIICQERETLGDCEKVYWGAFLKDAADIDPLPLAESDVESFWWEVSPEIPPKLAAPFQVVTKAKGPFKNKAAVAELIQAETASSRPTAFRRVTELLNYGLLRNEEGQIVVASALKKAA